MLDELEDELARVYWEDGRAQVHSALAKRDLSVSLDKLGLVEMQTENLAAARDLFQRSLLVAASLHRWPAP